MLYNSFNFLIHLIYLRNHSWRDEKYPPLVTPITHTHASICSAYAFFFEGDWTLTRNSYWWLFSSKALKICAFYWQSAGTTPPWQPGIQGQNAEQQFWSQDWSSHRSQGGLPASFWLLHSCQPPRSEPGALWKRNKPKRERTTTNAGKAAPGQAHLWPPTYASQP